MAKNRLVPYLQGTLIKSQSGELRQMRITTAETTPGKQLRTAKDYSDVFLRKLGQFGHLKTLSVVIDSRGGSFYSAAGIQDALHKLTSGRKPAVDHIRILIDGHCASAATYVAFGMYEHSAVFITPGSRVYVHMPKVYQYTQTDGIWGMIEKIGTKLTKKSFVGLYKRKTGKPSAEIWEWMKNGKWFTAEEAVDVGFCDGIMTRTQFDRG